MISGLEGQMFHIVLLEDNPADVYLFRRALKGVELNFQLTVIENGADGLTFARRGRAFDTNSIPDLAVLDLNMPKVAGIEILEAMRENKVLERVPIVIMTSSATPREQAKAEELGVEQFITKPLDLEEFLQIGHVVKGILLRSKVGSAIGTL